MICIFCTLYGHNRTPDVPMFLAIYIPYLVFPMCVIWRMWHENPFSAKVRVCFLIANSCDIAMDSV